MALLEDMCTYFKGLGLISDAGVDAFIDFTPESPDNLVALHEYKSDPASPFIDEVHRSVQIMVRNKSASESRRIADALYAALKPSTENRRVQFTSTRWGQVYLRQTPCKLLQDESDRTIYSFNLGITTKI